VFWPLRADEPGCNFPSVGDGVVGLDSNPSGEDATELPVFHALMKSGE